MEGLEQIVWELSEMGIVVDVWVDGSFTTKKFEPDDSDVVVCIKSEFLANMTREQQTYISDFQRNRKGFKDKFYCDLYFYIDHSHATSEWLRSYWIRQFGFSRNDDMKGIVVVSTPTNNHDDAT